MLFEKTIVLDKDPNKLITEVRCTNDDYHFSLSRNEKDSPYLLTSYAPRKSGDHRPGNVSGYAYRGIGYLLSAVDSAENYALRELKWDRERSLVHACVEITVATKPPSTQTRDLWFDPQNQWRVVEQNARSSRNNSEFSKITYGQLIDGFGYPSTIVTTTTDTGAKARPQTTITGQLKVEKTTKSPRDFRLSAFALPEPVGFITRSRTPTVAWLLGIACGFCCLSAILFRWMARGRMNGAAPSKA